MLESRRLCHRCHGWKQYVSYHLTLQDLLMLLVAYSALVDFILALLPWKIILGLQMKRHEKIRVAVAMSLGLL